MMKKMHCVSCLLQVRTSWYGSSFEHEITTKLPVFTDRLFTLCSWMRTIKNYSPIFSAVTVRCIYVSFLNFYWHRQTRNKEQTKLTACTESEGERIHIIVLCSVSVGLLTNNKKSANNTCKRTAKTSWNSRLVTQSVLIFINLQTTYVALVIIFIQFLQNKKREGTLSIKKWILPMSTGAYNTTHLRSLLAPLICCCFFPFISFLCWSIFNIFIVSFVFSVFLWGLPLVI